MRMFNTLHAPAWSWWRNEGRGLGKKGVWEPTPFCPHPSLHICTATNTLMHTNSIPFPHTFSLALFPTTPFQTLSHSSSLSLTPFSLTPFEFSLSSFVISHLKLHFSSSLLAYILPLSPLSSLFLFLLLMSIYLLHLHVHAHRYTNTYNYSIIAHYIQYNNMLYGFVA